MDAHVDMMDLLHQLRDEADAGRASLVKATNSGGIPIIGEPWHASVYAEATSVRFAQVADVGDQFHQRTMDEHSIRTVQRICVDERVYMHREDMPEGSLLRRLYDAIGVDAVEKVFLISEKGAVWFLVLNYTDMAAYERAQELHRPAFTQRLEKLRTLLRLHQPIREKLRLRR